MEEIDKLFVDAANNEKVIIDVKSILNKEEILAGGYSYWRLFWTIPIIPVVALTFTSIISNGKTKWQRYGLVLILSFLALRSGCYLYKYPDTGFVKANNAVILLT